MLATKAPPLPVLGGEHLLKWYTLAFGAEVCLHANGVCISHFTCTPTPAHFSTRSPFTTPQWSLDATHFSIKSFSFHTLHGFDCHRWTCLSKRAMF